MRKIAMTDMHGCFLSFEVLLDKVALTTADELYLLGDYVDRGPDSKGVIDKIFELREKGYTVRCLAGNHEAAMLTALEDRRFSDRDWSYGWGGQQTMESFGVEKVQAVPEKYWEFLRGLDYYLLVDEFILVHAGLDFNLPDPLAPDVSMLFLRDWYSSVDYGWLGQRIIVHGHTPVSKDTIEQMHRQLDRTQVIDIDGGCFAKHLPGKGWLCAFDLTNRQLFFQKNIDDVSGYWASR